MSQYEILEYLESKTNPKSATIKELTELIGSARSCVTRAVRQLEKHGQVRIWFKKRPAMVREMRILARN